MLATACGYTFDAIDAMTMADFNQLAMYWQDHPPTHILIAAQLGYKPKKPVSSGPDDALSKLLGVDPRRGGTMRLMH